MKQVKTQTRTRETDFKSLWKSFIGSEDEYDLYDNISEIDSIEKMKDISEEDKKILITSLVGREKLAKKLFSVKSKTRRKKSSIKIDASENSKKDKYTARTSSKIMKDIEDKEIGEK